MPPIGHLESNLTQTFVVTYRDMHQLSGAPELKRLTQWRWLVQKITVRTRQLVSKGRSFAVPLIFVIFAASLARTGRGCPVDSVGRSGLFELRDRRSKSANGLETVRSLQAAGRPERQVTNERASFHNRVLERPYVASRPHHQSRWLRLLASLHCT